jgi:hypothetical protein
MADRSTARVRRLIDAVLISAGDTDTDIRRAVVARAAALGGRAVPTTSELPECRRPAWIRSLGTPTKPPTTSQRGIRWAFPKTRSSRST